MVGLDPQFVHLHPDRLEHRQRRDEVAFAQACAIASGVTRSIQATFRPNALAPQASHGFDDTNSTSAGGTPSTGFDQTVGLRASA